jgi:hypothetical protein
MKSLFSALDGAHRTPAGVGLALLAVNLGLMVAFALSMAFLVLLGQIGVNIPPWVVISLFGIAAIYLWFRLAMLFPKSFSLFDACRSMLIGAAPVVLVTAAEYAFLLVDPAGCVGAHILLLILGSLSLGAMTCVMVVGFLVGRRTHAA